MSHSVAPDRPTGAADVVGWVRAVAGWNRLPHVLAGIIVLLVVAHLVAVSVGLPPFGHAPPLAQRLWLLDEERNISTAFSAAQMGACALLSWLIARRVRRAGTNGSAGWFALGLVMAYLMLDEGLTIHEELDGVAAGRVPDWLQFDWVLVLGPLAVLAAIAFLPWLRGRRPRVRRGLLVGLGTFGLGAIGVEVLGSFLGSTSGFRSSGYLAASTVEEFLEMVGIAVVCVTLARRFASDDPPADLAGAAGHPER